MKKIVIIGGGAAGMAAAIAAADADRSAEVYILERLDSPGKKLLATGNGRCNLTNRYAAPAHYRTSSPAALERIFSGMTPESVLDFFRQLGLWCAEEDEGRWYPRSRQASAVAEILQLALHRRGIRMACACPVTAISKRERGFVLESADGRKHFADAVVLTSGGKAAGKLGSDGSGYRLARSMGHHWAPLYPALVPLKCDMSRWGSLKGIRAEAGLRLLAGETLLGEEQGEVQFTEYGLSGIPVMQLSGCLSEKAPGAAAAAELDLFPETAEELLLQELRSRKQQDGELSCEQLLLGMVHPRLGWAVLRDVGISRLSLPVKDLSEQTLCRVACDLKHWRFPVLGTQGYDSAQVSGGGILLEEIQPETMESTLQPGLYFAGEILDVAGDCGGYNLHFAWCSGIRAGKNAAGR